MMTLKRLLIAPTAALALAAGGLVHADERIALDQLDTIIEHASAFGFTHYEEIEAKSGDSVEIEGWLDDEWHADVRLSLRDGQTLEEERKRLVSGAWGMSEEDLRLAFRLAADEGMQAFEEIEIKQTGVIEIEGFDASGRELEITLRQGSDTVSRVERD
ncbi:MULTISPECIES: PepSY domain-containing protein [Halomonadaceae]|uniref:PepSY domain-containing protein n=1 Tax=Halomonadaceae TaxID=28256 RepID=UPI0015988F59|nr:MULTISPECIES: PepSY domain-containing protein [Halomonas]QJQ93844.1 PepSY domain-containing protein [Halomonas sp. PA5]